MSLALAADLAASLLLLVAFVTHTLLAAILFAAWRGLRAAERALPASLGAAATRLDDVRGALQQVTRRAVAPQIDALAALAGLRAGWSALWGSTRRS